jgi:hypothetical protein
MAERTDTRIRITGRSTAREIGRRVEVEWTLDSEPDPEWTGVFQLAEIQGREGPVEWTQGGGPDVVGSTVRWFVAVDNLEEAEAEVAHRLDVANRRLFGPAGADA